MKPIVNFTLAAALATAATAWADVEQRTANNVQLVMEDIPAIPETIVNDLNRYQNVRSAGFSDWTEDGEGIYVSTLGGGGADGTDGRVPHRRTRS